MYRRIEGRWYGPDPALIAAAWVRAFGSVDVLNDSSANDARIRAGTWYGTEGILRLAQQDPEAPPHDWQQLDAHKGYIKVTTKDGTIDAGMDTKDRKYLVYTAIQEQTDGLLWKAPYRTDTFFVVMMLIDGQWQVGSYKISN